MRRKLVLVTVLAGALAFPAVAFAISRNGLVVGGGVGGPAHGNQFGAARNRGVGGAPFFRGGGMGGRLSGGPHVGGAAVAPKK